MLRFLTACFAIAVPASLLAQAPQPSQPPKPAKTFEVATIKPTDPSAPAFCSGFRL